MKIDGHGTQRCRQRPQSQNRGAELPEPFVPGHLEYMSRAPNPELGSSCTQADAVQGGSGAKVFVNWG